MPLTVTENKSDSRTVFVVHGRNTKARKALFQFLRSIGLHPLEWSEAVERTGKASPYVGEVLETAFSEAQAAIILFTPDDEARLCEELRGQKEPIYETELTGQARPNVIFEAGMAMGMYPKRTVIVELGELRPMSDIGGRHIIRMNNSVARRQELAQRLKRAGCNINIAGTDWHEEGDFALNFIPKPNIKTVSNKVLTKQKTRENITTRLNRILKIKNFELDYGRIYIHNTDGGVKTLEIPNNQGNFYLYTTSKNDANEGFYISNPYPKPNFENELADMRVLLEEVSEISELKFTFIIVSDADETENKQIFSTAFEKIKTFVTSKHNNNFKLEVWDENVILQLEKKLGIKVDL